MLQERHWLVGSSAGQPSSCSASVSLRISERYWLTYHKGRSRPAATEFDVEDQRMIEEVLVDIASSCKVGIWNSKRGWIGRCWAMQAGRNLIAWEEPDLDRSRSPLHSVDAAAISVEVGACAVRLGR